MATLFVKKGFHLRIPLINELFHFLSVSQPLCPMCHPVKQSQIHANYKKYKQVVDTLKPNMPTKPLKVQEFIALKRKEIKLGDKGAVS